MITVIEQLTNEQAWDRLRDLALVSGRSMREAAVSVLRERPTRPLPAALPHLTSYEEP